MEARLGKEHSAWIWKKSGWKYFGLREKFLKCASGHLPFTASLHACSEQTTWTVVYNRYTPINTTATDESAAVSAHELITDLVYQTWKSQSSQQLIFLQQSKTQTDINWTSLKSEVCLPLFGSGNKNVQKTPPKNFSILKALVKKGEKRWPNIATIHCYRHKKISPTHVHMSHTREPTGTGKNASPWGQPSYTPWCTLIKRWEETKLG